MKVAILSPVCWRTPPLHYGPWEQVASNIAEGMVKKGVDITLFATRDSFTEGKLRYICERPYEEDKSQDPKTNECLHISNLMEQAHEFDLIHNHFDFLTLTYSRLVDTPIITTIHGFSSPKIIPVYKKYNANGYYVSISNADRSRELDYEQTIYNGIDTSQFTLQENKKDYLLFFGRIHHDKGVYEAIQIAKKSCHKLIICGIIQDEKYFLEKVKPHIDNKNIIFAGQAGPKKRDRLLGAAKCLLHPINFHEPFGLSVAEAMACGTPVIAFNLGSMPELIEDGKTGFLVDSVDEAVEAIGHLAALDPVYCRKWAANQFSLEKMVDEYYNLYQAILTRRNA